MAARAPTRRGPGSGPGRAGRGGRRTAAGRPAAARARIAAGATSTTPTTTATTPADEQRAGGRGRRWAGPRRWRPTPPPSRHDGDAASERCTGVGSGRPPGQGGHHRHAGHRPGRPPRRRRRRDHGEGQARGDQAPRQVEPVDAVAGGGLDRRAPPRSSPRTPSDAADDRGDDARRCAPLATITRRRCRSVAPMAASSPSWRWRRWATTTNPAAATRPTSAMARVTTTSTTAATAGVVVAERPSTPERRPSPGRPAAAPARPPSRSTDVDQQGERDVGAVGVGARRRANSSSRSPGFSTRPTTVRVAPAEVDPSPMPADEQVGAAVGERDLVGSVRVAAVAQRRAAGGRRPRRGPGPAGRAASADPGTRDGRVADRPRPSPKRARGGGDVGLARSPGRGRRCGRMAPASPNSSGSGRRGVDRHRRPGHRRRPRRP